MNTQTQNANIENQNELSRDDVNQHPTNVHEAQRNIDILNELIRRGLASKRQTKEAIRKLGFAIKVKGQTADLTQELSGLEDELVECEIALEELSYDLNTATQQKVELIGHQKLEMLTADAEDIQFNLGFDAAQNPTLYARLLGSMAGTLQYALESGLPFYNRLQAQAYERGPNGEDPAEKTDLQVMEQIRAIEEERDFIKTYMIALKSEYDRVKTEHSAGERWFPEFLYRSNAQVRDQVQKREEDRLKAFLEEREKLRSEVGRLTYAQEDSSTPRFK